MIAGSTTIRLLADITDVLRKFGQVTGEAQKTSRGVQSAFAGMGSAMKNALSGIGIAALTHQMGQMADAVTSLRNGLVLATGSVEKANDAYYKLFNIAQQSRVSFVELGNTFGSISRAGDGLGLTQGQLLIVTESLGNAMAVSGGTAQGMQAAMMQLSQGLASGVLRGEELNSVMEQTPRVARALADGLGVPIGQLRKMGEAGELTAERVIGALMSQSEVLRREVEGAVMTIGQAFVLTMNSATLLVGEIDRVTGASAQVSAEMRGVSDAASGIAMAFLEVDSAGNRVSLTGGVIRVVFETLAVLAVNVAFTFRMVGQEIGGIAAQAHAFLTEGMDGVRAIRGMMIADAQAARAEVDALSERIVNSSALAAQARAEAEEARKKELERIPQMIQEMERRRAQAQSSARRAATSATRSMQADEFAAERAAAQEWARAWEDFAQMVRQAENETLGLSKAQERLKTFLTSPAYQNMSEPMRQLVIEQAQAAIGAEQAAAAHAEQAKALEEVTKAEAARIQEMERGAQTVQERLQALRDEDEAAEMAARQNIALAEAVELVAIARLRERQAIERLMGDDRAVEAIEREIVARRELGAVMSERAGRDLSRAAAEEAEQNWRRTSESIENSLTDALMRGFESGKDFGRNLRDTIVNLFRTMVLRPIIQAVVSPVAMAVTGALGFSGAANASQAAGSLSGIRSIYDTIVGGFTRLGDSVAFAANDIGQWLVSNTTGVLNRFGGSLMGNASSLGTIGSYLGGAAAGLALGQIISGGYSAIGKSGNTANIGGTAIGAIFGGPIGAAIGGAIGGLVNRAFGRKAPVTTASGISGTFSTDGANVQNYEEWFAKGGWFRSDKSGVNYSAVSNELDNFLDQALRQVTAATKMYANVLSLNADAVNGITQSVKISLMGLNAEQQQEAVMKALGGFGDKLAEQLLGTFETYTVQTRSWFRSRTETRTRWVPGEFVREGETAGEALARLANSLYTVNAAFDTLNQTLLHATLVGGDAASALLDAFGGAEAFVQGTTAYYQAFYTEQERVATTTRQLTDVMASMGLALPATREQFRALVESQDLYTESGRQTYAALIKLAPAFDEIQKAAEAIASERASLERQLLELQGDSAALAEIERNSLSEANRAIYDRIQAIKAEQEASRNAAEAERLLAEARNRINEQAYALQGRLLQLQGDTIALRARELAETDEANRYILERIYALEDEQAAAQAAQRATDAAFDAVQRAITAAAQAAEQSITAAYEALRQSLETQLESARAARDVADESLNSLRSIFDMLKEQIADLRGEASAGMTPGQGLAFIDQAIATARATGYMPEQGSLSEAIAAARSGLRAENYATSFELRRDRLMLAGKLGDLQTLVGEQMTVAERQLAVAEEQLASLESRLEQARVQYEEELARNQAYYNQTLLNAQTQINELRGINQSVLGVSAAMAGLASAISSEMAAELRALGGALAASKAPSAAYSVEDTPAERQAKVEYQTGVKVSAADSPLVAAAKVLYQAIHGGASSAEYNAAAAAVGGNIGAALGWNGSREDAARIRAQYGFAAGGLHAGGVRMVGENGPEIEVTGPARYYSAGRTAAMLGGGAEVANEVRQLREENQAQARAMVQLQARVTRLLERWDGDGMPETRSVTA